ncbi:MAG: hypothetical protein ABIH11_06125 [Candidatus Altiarchaeota archaeon]
MGCRMYVLLAAVLLAATYYSMHLMSGAGRQELNPVCDEFPAEYLDYCLYRKSSFTRHEANKSVSYCLQIGRENVRGHCMTDVAVFAIFNKPEDSVGRKTASDVCAILDGVWRDECFFKSAEALANAYTDYGHAYDSCRMSGGFEHDCIGHLSDIVSQRSIASAFDFCGRVRDDYSSVSQAPVDYCFHHIGLRLGSSGGSTPCALVSKCNAAGEYNLSCINGLLNTYGDVKSLCACPNVGVDFKDMCVK